MNIDNFITQSEINPSWNDILVEAIATMDQAYLDSLRSEPNWLPGVSRLFSAFKNPFDQLRYILIGESPYPRIESANGIAFHDAAVSDLWSEKGLSKSVNRATSLRNIMKTALLAEGLLKPDDEGKVSQTAIADLDKSSLINSADELFTNWQQRGFLLMNATPVLHDDRKPALEARYWMPFNQTLLRIIAQKSTQRITLVLWGKIAATIDQMEIKDQFDQIICEHPYNLSFIDNAKMQNLFGELRLLSR